MYLDSDDYMTVWKLAHHWSGYDHETSDEKNLAPDLQKTLFRIVRAINVGDLRARTRHRAILFDSSSIATWFDLPHLLKLSKCLRKGVFDKHYLDSVYLRRPEVLVWCKTEFLTPPKCWDLEAQSEGGSASYDVSDDEDDSWYGQLTERRRQRIACLELAKKLWAKNPNQSYEDIFKHPLMKEYGNTNLFSFNTFKKWSRDFAPEFAKSGGRPIKNN